MGRIPTMAFGWSWFTDNSFVSDYTICMIEIFQIFWAAPIELKTIVLSIAVAFPLLAYFGMKGTGL